MANQFYHFSQNNSGGSFDFDEKTGVTHHVIVEAKDADDAVRRAERIGLYWDGVETGEDCSCCGNRWDRPWREDGTEKPSVNGTDPAKYLEQDFACRWMKEGREICVHHINGDKSWF